ncbi:MAG TPA: DUF2249 domain-containing protein [Mycobacteriales bacterium]
MDALTRVVVRACRQLGEAGEPEAAGRLAATAWVVVRAGHPRQARHLDGVMHHIARLEPGTPPSRTGHPSGPARSSGRRSGPTREKVPVPTPDSPDRVLDVRTEIPRRRHELIFETFGDLATGDTYVLVNDHDPKPLRYQFEAENAGEFSWEYLEEGPEVWRVRIGRVADAGAAARTGA